ERVVGIAVAGGDIDEVHAARCGGAEAGEELAGVAPRHVTDYVRAGIDRAAGNGDRPAMYLARIGLHAGLGQGTGDIEAEIGIARKEARAHILRMLDAEIGADARALGA